MENDNIFHNFTLDGGVRDLDEKRTTKKRFGYLFRPPLFLGKWYGVATYFSLYKKGKEKILITKYMTK